MKKNNFNDPFGDDMDSVEKYDEGQDAYTDYDDSTASDADNNDDLKQDVQEEDAEKSDEYDVFEDSDDIAEDYDEDIELNDVDEGKYSDNSTDNDINKQYNDWADGCLIECGLEPCAREWISMSLEKRQEITKKLVEIRDKNIDDKKIVQQTGNALFFLNIKFFLSVCHRKVQKHSSGGQDYKDKIESALNDIWEFCSSHWLTYNPDKATYTTYMSPAQWKVSGFAVGSATERLSEQTANKFAQIRKAENKLAKMTGQEAVSDLLLQTETGFPQKVINDYRTWCKSTKSKQLDENMPASKVQLEKAEYMRNPEDLVTEKNQRELVLSRILALFPDIDEKDLEIIKLKAGLGTTANTESIASMLDVSKERVSSVWNKVRTKLQKDREISALVYPGRTQTKQTLTTNILMKVSDNTLGIVNDDEEEITDGDSIKFIKPGPSVAETMYSVVEEEELVEFGINNDNIETGAIPDNVEVVDHNNLGNEEIGEMSTENNSMITAMLEDGEQIVPEPAQPKRGPGRPKGSKNKNSESKKAIEADNSGTEKKKRVRRARTKADESVNVEQAVAATDNTEENIISEQVAENVQTEPSVPEAKPVATQQTQANIDILTHAVHVEIESNNAIIGKMTELAAYANDQLKDYANASNAVNPVLSMLESEKEKASKKSSILLSIQELLNEYKAI